MALLLPVAVLALSAWLVWLARRDLDPSIAPTPPQSPADPPPVSGRWPNEVLADPTFQAAIEELEDATVASPGPSVSFEVYVAPDELAGVTDILGVPVMHSRTVQPGAAVVFDRLQGRYLT